MADGQVQPLNVFRTAGSAGKKTKNPNCMQPRFYNGEADIETLISGFLGSIR